MKAVQVQGGNLPKSYADSFLVSQLKKQNRHLKLDLQSKESQVDDLKRNIKLSKVKEAESDTQCYIDECKRMRDVLEQQVITT